MTTYWLLGSCLQTNFKNELFLRIDTICKRERIDDFYFIYIIYNLIYLNTLFCVLYVFYPLYVINIVKLIVSIAPREGDPGPRRGMFFLRG